MEGTLSLRRKAGRRSAPKFGCTARSKRRFALGGLQPFLVVMSFAGCARDARAALRIYRAHNE